MAMKNVLCVMVLLAVSPLGTLGRATGKRIIKQITSDDFSTVLALKSYLEFEMINNIYSGAFKQDPIDVTGTLEYRAEDVEIIYDLKYNAEMYRVCPEEDLQCRQEALFLGRVVLSDCTVKFVDSAKKTPRFTMIETFHCKYEFRM